MDCTLGFSPWRSRSHRSRPAGLPPWGEFNLAWRGHNFTSFMAVFFLLRSVAMSLCTKGNLRAFNSLPRFGWK